MTPIGFPYNTAPPSEDFEEELRFKKAMDDPVEFLWTLQSGKDSRLTKEHLFEVVKSCAQENACKVVTYIQNSYLSEEQRFEIAIACAQESVWDTAIYIQNFSLSEEHRFEIAIACALKDDKVVPYSIKKFDLTEEQRFEIAKACAQKDGGTTAEHIQNFRLTEKQCFEIAIICAQQNGGDMAMCCQCFQLTPEHRFEIAKFCAQNNGKITSEYIRNFCLTDQRQLFEVAKLCAQQNSGATARLIKNYGLTQQQLFAIAIICIQNDAQETIEFIFNFGLTEPRQFFELAKHSAINSFLETLKILSLFSPSESERFEVAKLCAQHYGNFTLKYIGHFKLSDPAQLSEIFILAALQDPWSLRFIPDGLSPFKQILRDLYHDSPLSEIIDRFSAIPKQGLNSSRLASALRNIEEPEQQKEAIVLAASALFVWERIFTPEQLQWVFKNMFLEQILALKAPYLRKNLVRLVTETPENFDSIPGTLPPLLKLPLAKLHAQGVRLDSLTIPEHALRDSAVLIPFLETMMELADNEILSSEQKTDIVEAMSQNPFSLARDLLIILNFRRADLLQTNLKTGLPALAEEAFRSVLPLPQPVKDLSNLFQDTFGSYRDSYALETYAANLNKNRTCRPALEALGLHVYLVLNGTYLIERYDPMKNPHLQFLEEQRPGILRAWQQNSTESLGEVEQTAATHSTHQWLYEKLNDGHMRLLPFLEEFLRNPEQARPHLIEQRKKNPKSPNITLQLKCYDLSRSTDRKNTLRLLREIDSLVPSNSEFKNDIQAKIASLTKTQSLANLTISETDDPEDLLVSGTEIRGSCQRVDGDSSLNRGLVGYLRNGQTRMIAVKDKTGRIAARCLLRLLVDKKDKPVLFLERFYSNINDPRLHTAIIAKAKQAADRLLCPLTSLEGEVEYGSPLESLGGPAPWEYIDGASGIQESKYMIDNAKLLYDPGSG